MKRLISLALALAMLLAFSVPATIADPNNLTFTVGSAAAAPGEAISIPLKISNNGTNVTGVGAAIVRIDFDSSILEWDPSTPFTNGKLFGFARPGPANISDSHVVLNFDSMWGSADDGAMVTLGFVIKSSAPPGTTAIKIDPAETRFADDVDLIDIPSKDYNLVNGTVTVSGNPAASGTDPAPSAPDASPADSPGASEPPTPTLPPPPPPKLLTKELKDELARVMMGMSLLGLEALGLVD